MSALAATVSYLLADTRVSALAGSRVWAWRFPDNELQLMPRQCVIVGRSGGAATGPGARSYSEWGNGRFDVFTYGADELEAERLQAAVFQSLTQMASNDERTRIRQYDDTILRNAVCTGGPLPGRDADGDWPYLLTVFDVSSIPAS